MIQVWLRSGNEGSGVRSEKSTETQVWRQEEIIYRGRRVSVEGGWWGGRHQQDSRSSHLSPPILPLGETLIFPLAKTLTSFPLFVNHQLLSRSWWSTNFFNPVGKELLGELYFLIRGTDLSQWATNSLVSLKDTLSLILSRTPLHSALLLHPLVHSHFLFFGYQEIIYILIFSEPLGSLLHIINIFHWFFHPR